MVNGQERGLINVQQKEDMRRRMYRVKLIIQGKEQQYSSYQKDWLDDSEVEVINNNFQFGKDQPTT